MSIEHILVYVVVFAAIAALVYIHRDRVRADLVVDEKALADHVAKQEAIYRKWLADQVVTIEAKAKDAVKTEVTKVL